MTEWEYRIVKVAHVTEKELNFHGWCGWELVDVFQAPSNVVLFFKRPKKEKGNDTQ